MQLELADLEEFDQLLVVTIVEVLQESLGVRNARIVLDYLEKMSCPIRELPDKLPIFSVEMRKLLGSERGQLLGSAAILEETIAKVLCFKLRVEFEEQVPIVLSKFVEKLRGVHHKKKEIVRSSRGT
ncbi:MAG: hypothetical protein ABSB89_05725 [Candidatus Bathyarchaeia archaeon]|jgi:hypothetical protein